MGSKEVEGWGAEELLLLLLLLPLLSSRADDCSGRVSSAVGPSGTELSSPLSLFSVPGSPLTAIKVPNPALRDRNGKLEPWSPYPRRAGPPRHPQRRPS